jgi:hypothetical protein
VLALSSIVTLTLLELRSKVYSAETILGKSTQLLYYLACLLLSLTHYFGWIYVFVLSLVNFLENRVYKAHVRAVMLVVAISLWPAWHVLVGTLGSRSGGDFWIKVDPPIVGTYNTFLGGSLPFVPGIGSQFLLVYSLLAVVVFVSLGSWKAILSFFRPRGIEVGSLADEARFSLLSIILVVGMMAIVDLHTPMSTTRNYIVLIPASMILVSNSLVMLANLRGARSPSGAAAGLAGIVVILLLSRQSLADLNGKHKPHQNWKGLTEYVEKSGVCTDGCYALGSSGLHEFYFTSSENIAKFELEKGSMGSSKDKLSLQAQVDSIKNIPNVKILGFHGASRHIPDLLAATGGRECIQPMQGWDNSTYMILPKSSLTGKEQALNMRPCADTN